MAVRFRSLKVLPSPQAFTGLLRALLPRLVPQPDARTCSVQEKISEDLRATLNAFLHRTGQHSSK